MLLTLATAAPAPSELVPRAHGLWMPEQASTIADSVDGVFHLITWISAFFFVLITVLLVFFVVKYRRMEGRRPEESPTHHTTLELTWTIIPLLLVIVIFYVGMQGYIHQTTVPADAYRVNVTAQKWDWNFHYVNGCNPTNVLYVPVGRPVELVMTSTDVLHSLYVPAFRAKMDVVPGRYTRMWFEATRPGTFELYCAEYCGTQHSQMVGTVIALEDDELEAELEKCARWIDDVSADWLHVAGARLFNEKGCTQCHTVDLAKTRLTGPPLRETHELFVAGGTRQFVDGRSRVVDEDYIRDSILVPGRDIVIPFPNTMPSFQGILREREVFAVIEFLRRLDEFELDNRDQIIVPEIPQSADGDAEGTGDAPSPDSEVEGEDR